MKAIILAAGMGTRLGKYTEELPKCMLNFNGKPLIEHQVETLRKAGITDITIIKGYMPEKINLPETKTYHNEKFSSTNMVETLFCAEKELNGDVLICYADILYEPRILREVILSKANVGVVVDENYWQYWSSRSEKPEEDMESLVIDNENKIVDLGNPDCSKDEAKFRYVGLIKLSKEGVETLKKVYHQQKVENFHKDEPWLRSKSFKKAYMTCMLQAIINSGHRVDPIVINKGWLEFDTVEDYEKYNQWMQTGTISQYINLY